MMKILIVLCLLFTATSLFAGEDHLQQGAKYLQDGNPGRAVRAFELAIKAGEQSAEAYKGLGLAYYRLGDYRMGYNIDHISLAVKALQQAVALLPDPEAHYHLGLSYLILHRKKEAEEERERLKTMDPVLAEKLAKKLALYVSPPRLQRVGGGTTRRMTRTEGADATPVEIHGNTVLVPVTFSYRGNVVSAMLILDTGASVTTISEGLAARLGVHNGDTGSVTGVVADGRHVNGRSFVADSVDVGPKNAGNLRTIILSGSGGAGYDGLLGMDFLRRFRYQIDFDRKAIDWKN